jgi:CheY-like chemotaxis protein
MTRPQQSLLLVDPDDRARTNLAKQLEPLDLRVVQAKDGDTALALLGSNDIRVMISELYLPTRDRKCLIAEARRTQKRRDIRIIAHTHRMLGADRDWALEAGADAYLIKPTRASRVRYVVGRLLATPVENVPPSNAGTLLRRDSLDLALLDIEQGRLDGSSCIVFGRAWWQALASTERMTFRSRAKAAHVSLRSDSQIGEHYVEIRGRYRPDLGPATEQPESPYRR